VKPSARGITRAACGNPAVTPPTGCTLPAQGLSEDADGRGLGWAYLRAMLTPKVICLSQTPTAHPAGQRRPVPAIIASRS
jgi:hypothetical protein